MRLFTRTILIGLICLAALTGGRAAAQPGRDIIILTPATPASIPVILAVKNLPGVKLTIFYNHSQAHSLFLTGKAQILSTGISVGVQFFRQGVPVKIINSHVTGLSFLVTTRPIREFRELKGMKIWLPFPGSPLEEITRFLAQSEGLVWEHDIHVGYAMFATSVKLLQQKRIEAAVLPEPYVSLAETDPDLFVSLDYARLWETIPTLRTPVPRSGPLPMPNGQENTRRLLPDSTGSLNPPLNAAFLTLRLPFNRPGPILNFRTQFYGQPSSAPGSICKQGENCRKAYSPITRPLDHPWMKHLLIFFKPLVRTFFSLGAVIAIWAVSSLFFDPYVLPSPMETVKHLDRLCTPALAQNMGQTLARVGAGFAVSFVAGSMIGILAHVLNISAWVENLMMMVQVLPGIIIGVIFLLMVGVGSLAPVLLIIFMTAPFIAINTAAALAKADPLMEAVIRSVNGTQWHFVKDLYVPRLVPAMRANASMGIAMALKVAILGEFIASENGLGYQINVSRIYFNMGEVFFYLVVILMVVLGFQLVIHIVFFFFFKKYFYPG
nr:ABC transporter permease subunit [Desulfobacula sp.]